MAVKQNGFQSGHQVFGGKGFYDVTLRAGEERSAHYLRGSVLSEEQYPDFGRHLQDLLRYLNSVYVRQTDIEYHNIRLKLQRFLDRSQPIRGFTHDLNFRFYGEGKRNEMQPGRVIIYNKDLYG
jgi:hypothetical protein